LRATNCARQSFEHGKWRGSTPSQTTQASSALAQDKL
jgi:hypothetical protein